jgi:Big-like domain-containing protein
MSATTIAIDRAYRFASKAPLLEISSSDPVDTATGVAVNKTITLTLSTPLSPETVTNANITMTTNPARTTTLDPVNHRIVTIDPTSNLTAATSYTVTATSGLRGLYGPWQLRGTGDSISFTTA